MMFVLGSTYLKLRSFPRDTEGFRDLSWMMLEFKLVTPTGSAYDDCRIAEEGKNFRTLPSSVVRACLYPWSAAGSSRLSHKALEAAKSCCKLA